MDEKALDENWAHGSEVLEYSSAVSTINEEFGCRHAATKRGANTPGMRPHELNLAVA